MHTFELTLQTLTIFVNCGLTLWLSVCVLYKGLTQELARPIDLLRHQILKFCMVDDIHFLVMLYEFRYQGTIPIHLLFNHSAKYMTKISATPQSYCLGTFFCIYIINGKQYLQNFMALCFWGICHCLHLTLQS